MVQTDEPMTGAVEMDEMYVGGKPRLYDTAAWDDLPFLQKKAAASSWANKTQTPVFGMVERKGRVAAHVVPSTRSATLMPYVKTRVLPEAVIYTDQATVYRKSLPAMGYRHKRVHHQARVYVEGDAHTNTIEGLWSLVKRGIGGTHHAVSAKHLQGYLNEYAWRYNHRMDGRSQFETLLLRAARR
jgi:transposase